MKPASAAIFVVFSVSLLSLQKQSYAASPVSSLFGNRSSHVTIIGGNTVTAQDPVAASTVLIYGTEPAPRQPQWWWRLFPDNGSDGSSNNQGTGFICTGSILSSNIVITAAHCLGETGKATLTVIFETDIHADGQSINKNHTVKVVNQRKPSDSLPTTQDTDWDDIAILELASPIPSNYQPATILSDPSAIQAGTNVLLAGYGIDVPAPPTNPSDDGGAGVLREVSQTVLNPNYGQTEVLVSLQGSDGSPQGACHGDSGGPAFIQQPDGSLLLFGVTSRLTKEDQVANNGNAQDYQCAKDMVYSNILTHIDWINATVAKFGGQPIAGLAQLGGPSFLDRSRQGSSKLGRAPEQSGALFFSLRVYPGSAAK